MAKKRATKKKNDGDSYVICWDSAKGKGKGKKKAPRKVPKKVKKATVTNVLMNYDMDVSGMIGALVGPTRNLMEVPNPYGRGVVTVGSMGPSPGGYYDDPIPSELAMGSGPSDARRGEAETLHKQAMAKHDAEVVRDRRRDIEGVSGKGFPGYFRRAGEKHDDYYKALVEGKKKY